MNEKEFNLLDEPWIRVIDGDCRITELSLTELFGNAHLYKDLCGELPTQDFAVMRLLLAVLHTVFSRYDLDGTESPLNDPDDALDRWEALWENEKFPSKVITDYLESQREGFYLFHPERPFYQCKYVERVNKSYETTKLNGMMSKSDHADRLFITVGKSECKSLEFAEAARWLINIISFDDSAVKAAGFSKNGQKLDSPGVGWLGKLGLIAAYGNNLFQTLLLNLILLNENGDLYNSEKPIWESKKAIERERIKILPPDNLSELYTLPSRLLLLQRESKKVCKYKILSGFYFDEKNSFIEPMTLWHNINSKTIDQYVPQTHDSTRACSH